MRSGAMHVPSFGQVVNVTVEPMPADPDKAVEFTIRRMREYAEADSRSPIVRAAVMDAAPGGGSVVEVCRSIFIWARSHVRFETDDTKSEGAGFGRGNEVLVRPVDLLRMSDPSEDCDGFAMLVASMLMAARDLFALPLQVCFCTLATHADAPKEFTHVYGWVNAQPAGCFAMDASHGPSFGWELPNRFNKRKLWPVGESMFATVNAPKRLGRAGRGLSGLRRMGDVISADDPLAGVIAWQQANPGLATGDLVPDWDLGRPYVSDYFPSLNSNAGSSAGGGAFNFNSLISSLVSAGSQIGVAALAQPGTKLRQSPSGSSVLSLPQSGVQQISSLLPWALGAVVAVVAIKAVRR